jgi:hypothetical protein
MGKISTLGVPSAALGTGSSDSAPSSAVSRDKSVRRCAQDDVLVGVLKKNIPNKLALMGLAPRLPALLTIDRTKSTPMSEAHGIVLTVWPDGVRFVCSHDPVPTIRTPTSSTGNLGERIYYSGNASV